MRDLVAFGRRVESFLIVEPLMTEPGA